jgi:tetratricopeptide (TPR) repeat protein
MGSFRDFLARWFGKPARPEAPAGPGGSAGRPRRVKQPRPEKVTPLGENSPLVAFTQGGMSVIMDLDAFDYTYGDADGPDPAQRDLDELLARVTRVCVLSGAMFRGRALGGDVWADVDDPEAVRELGGCLRIVEDARTFGHCACLGGPTIELYCGPELAATLGLQHGKAIRWARWYHDAQLRDGRRLDRWLADRGVDPARLQAAYTRGDNFLMGRPEPASGQESQARELAGRALARARGGDLAGALDDCNRALQLHADAGTYGLRGQVQYHLRRFEEAAADCTAAIRRGLRDSAVYLTLGWADDARGRPEEALASFSMSLHHDSKNAAAINSRGLVRARLGRPEEALADFDVATRLAPDWFLPHWNRGILRQLRGDAAGAVEDCSEVLRVLERPPADEEHRPGGPGLLAAAFVRRGEALLAAGGTGAAREDFDRALAHVPDYAGALSARGWLHFQEGRDVEAFADFTEVIRLASRGEGWAESQPGADLPWPGRPPWPHNWAAAYAQRADAHLRRAQWGTALEDLDEAIRREPGAAYLYVMRGQAYFHQGRQVEAGADLDEAVHLEPEAPLPRQVRAHVRGLRGDYAGERADLEAVLRTDPEELLTCNLLAWRLATRPDPGDRDGPRAVTLATSACAKSDWKNLHFLDTLAAALAECGQFEEACRREEQTLALLQEDADRTGYLARLEGYRSGRPHREPAAGA